MSTIEQSSNENFIARIWNGNAGLATSYWFYTVFAGFVWSIAFGMLQIVPGSGAAKLFLSCMAVYFVIVYVGVWRAANKYQGNKGLARLAKFCVVFGVLVTIVPIVVGLFHSISA